MSLVTDTLEVVAAANSHISNLTLQKTKGQDHLLRKSGNEKLPLRILKVHQDGTRNKANKEKKNLIITEALLNKDSLKCCTMKKKNCPKTFKIKDNSFKRKSDLRTKNGFPICRKK
jgi:hypothetical protein